MSTRFTAFIAGWLGLDAYEAATLVTGMRARLGGRSFAVRAAGFTIALRVRAVPRSMRRLALVAFVGPLLETPVALNAFGARRRLPSDDPCAGLVQDG